ncbi:stage III sporulation protein AH [Geomicrobium sp. JCM 19038]|nr:stage III sporulation protein AH [Geomicrobium sp. JCM 19038]
MVLKKQTVWLLTMLSLVAVLGVYFFGPQSPTTQEASLINDNQSLEDFEGELWEQYLEENPDQAVVVEEWNGEIEGVNEDEQLTMKEMKKETKKRTVSMLRQD